MKKIFAAMLVISLLVAMCAVMPLTASATNVKVIQNFSDYKVGQVTVDTNPNHANKTPLYEAVSPGIITSITNELPGIPKALKFDNDFPTSWPEYKAWTKITDWTKFSAIVFYVKCATTGQADKNNMFCLMPGIFTGDMAATDNKGFFNVPGKPVIKSLKDGTSSWSTKDIVAVDHCFYIKPGWSGYIKVPLNLFKSLTNVDITSQDLSNVYGLNFWFSPYGGTSNAVYFANFYGIIGTDDNGTAFTVGNGSSTPATSSSSKTSTTSKASSSSQALTSSQASTSKTDVSSSISSSTQSSIASSTSVSSSSSVDTLSSSDSSSLVQPSGGNGGSQNNMVLIIIIIVVVAILAGGLILYFVKFKKKS